MFPKSTNFANTKPPKVSIQAFCVYGNTHLFNVTVLTFSKQSLNESLDFCNRSYPHELHKFDWQLQAHLPVQYASNIELIRQKWYWGEFNNASARRALVDWYLSLFIMCKAWHQYNERPRALALLNLPLVLWLTASHTWVARAKQASCLLYWLSVFKLAVPLFHFTLNWTKPFIRLYSNF